MIKTGARPPAPITSLPTGTDNSARRRRPRAGAGSTGPIRERHVQPVPRRDAEQVATVASWVTSFLLSSPDRPDRTTSQGRGGRTSVTNRPVAARACRARNTAGCPVTVASRSLVHPHPVGTGELGSFTGEAVLRTAPAPPIRNQHPRTGLAARRAAPQGARRDDRVEPRRRQGPPARRRQRHRGRDRAPARTGAGGQTIGLRGLWRREQRYALHVVSHREGVKSP